MIISVNVNGKLYTADVTPHLSLLDFLRAQGFSSVRCGCDTTSCGLCTVWVDGAPTLSCAFPAVRAQQHNITTLEGVQTEADELATFMASQGADQCGFCSPGLIMNILAMKRELITPSDAEINAYLAGNLCRCTGYMSHMRIIKAYLQEVSA